GARVAEAEGVVPPDAEQEEPGEAVYEQEVVVPEEEPAAFTATGSEDAGATQRIEPEIWEDEPTAEEVAPEQPESAEEQPTEILRTGDEGPLAEESPADEAPPAETVAEEAPAEEPEVTEPEVEPSTVQGETVQEPPEPEAADEVEREEPALAEESSSQEFFDREEGERGDSRIFRASRFLRRRE
ncbi:MAG TPA: hypothetical protein VFI90_00215, partial [Rubrobacter sp.]|nr:hypothetical protein [Rubrobacter sp.]